ncbi:hypothetical protein BY996DRAFT_6408159 [Phakopsora pachyrhizi]|nr:hypothetical protein BY996DRAFT_6408159 [Phakopsora pachyrhizi]
MYTSCPSNLFCHSLGTVKRILQSSVGPHMGILLWSRIPKVVSVNIALRTLYSSQGYGIAKASGPYHMEDPASSNWSWGSINFLGILLWSRIPTIMCMTIALRTLYSSQGYGVVRGLKMTQCVAYCAAAAAAQ